jgi:hypothetical protein
MELTFISVDVQNIGELKKKYYKRREKWLEKWFVLKPDLN